MSPVGSGNSSSLWILFRCLVNPDLLLKLLPHMGQVSLALTSSLVGVVFFVSTFRFSKAVHFLCSNLKANPVKVKGQSD